MRKLLLLVFVAAMCVPCYGAIFVYKTTAKATVFTGDVKAALKESGYLVLDVDTATQTVNAAQQITYGDGVQQTKVVTVALTSSAGYIVADYSSSDKDAVLFGKATATGAKSLKGSMLVGLGTANLGSGTFSATLDTKNTKAAAGSTIAAVVESIATVLDKKYTRITDTTPPTPNPMTWATEPNATSNTSITMTATTATDADSGPVEYFFTNVTDTGHNSSWQSSATFLDTSLTPDTNYTYTVKARDSAAVPNETTASAAKSAITPKTSDANAPEPNRMEWAVGGEPNGISSSEIIMTAALATDAQGIGGYYFTCVNDANFNSGWKSPTADSTNWTASTRTWIATHLAPAHTYAFTVKAKDNALVANITADSNQRSATTKADTNPPTPDPMTFATVPEANGASAIYMVATTATDDTNSATVEYFFKNVISSGGGSDSDWQASPIYQDTGLDSNSEYAYRVRARDASGNMTGWSDIKTVTTALSIQDRIDDAIDARNGALSTPTYPLVTVTIPAGTYYEDLEIYEPNITLKSASGKANTIIQLAGTYNGIDIYDDGAGCNGCTIGGSDGHGFTIIGDFCDTQHVIRTHGNDTEVSYCDINSAGNANHCVKVSDVTGVTIKNNNFFTDEDDTTVYLSDIDGGSIKNVLISNNVFDAIDSLAVYIGGADCCSVTITGNTMDCGIDIGVGGDGTKVKNLTISNNTFNSGSGIDLYEDSLSDEPNRLTNVAITGNTFAAGSNAYALLIEDLEANDVNWATLTFKNNVILRTPGGDTYTVDNQIGGAGNPGTGVVPSILDANDNYWGDPSGPTGGCSDAIGASISTFVTYQPFWTNEAKTTDANCPDGPG